MCAGVAPPEGACHRVFRIFRDPSNIARHARARQVWIRIAVDEPPAPTLYLEVRDDGIGAGLSS